MSDRETVKVLGKIVEDLEVLADNIILLTKRMDIANTRLELLEQAEKERDMRFGAG